MPKKTRREKIAAEKRRELRPEITPLYSLPTNYTPSNTTKITQTTSDSTYLYHDIRKTLVLGAFCIIAEIALFFISPQLGW